ncbi:RICIN domain-containing protein [Nocardia cyriacigeorgica]|uniref:RICIN domain-containing protein n=1 Tax=Nocardia cyriacigeorgica TaxID=135487 RepID=UPI0018958339|nr:RICIN domain-containing protein [Nocardia cyriacigeorgica]MBF6080256.1 RICIN domain-containing protein [Nocardia cyriacigeorgica]BDU06875.1 hypothetical protein FMUBM48_31380 [Nocardia cyriacigeorgica]
MEDGATYYLGNGACTEGSPDTRNSAVRLFPLKDVGNGSCTSLLRWTLRRQSTGGTYYYIIPDSFQGHYLTADPDAPAAVTARSQQWKALPQPNGTWVIQAADKSGGPRCLAAPPDGADAYDSLSLQPCNRTSASQDWTITAVKWKTDK